MGPTNSKAMKSWGKLIKGCNNVSKSFIVEYPDRLAYQTFDFPIKRTFKEVPGNQLRFGLITYLPNH